MVKKRIFIITMLFVAFGLRPGADTLQAARCQDNEFVRTVAFMSGWVGAGFLLYSFIEATLVLGHDDKKLAKDVVAKIKELEKKVLEELDAATLSEIREDLLKHKDDLRHYEITISRSTKACVVAFLASIVPFCLCYWGARGLGGCVSRCTRQGL